MSSSRSRKYSWAATKKWLKGRGYLVFRTEYYNAATGRSHDLGGIVDGIAFGLGRTILVQACTTRDFAAHLKKITESSTAAAILRKGDSPLWLVAVDPKTREVARSVVINLGLNGFEII